MKMFVFNFKGNKFAFPANHLLGGYYDNIEHITSIQFEGFDRECIINDLDGTIFDKIISFCNSSDTNILALDVIDIPSK